MPYKTKCACFDKTFFIFAASKNFDMDLETRFKMISEINRKTTELLKHATDENFGKLFSDCPRVNGDYKEMFGAYERND